MVVSAHVPHHGRRSVPGVAATVAVVGTVVLLAACVFLAGRGADPTVGAEAGGDAVVGVASGHVSASARVTSNNRGEVDDAMPLVALLAAAVAAAVLSRAGRARCGAGRVDGVERPRASPRADRAPPLRPA